MIRFSLNCRLLTFGLFSILIFCYSCGSTNKPELRPELVEFFGGYSFETSFREVGKINPGMTINNGGSGDLFYTGLSKNNDQIWVELFFIEFFFYPPITSIFETEYLKAYISEEYLDDEELNNIDYWITYFTDMLDFEPIHYYDLSHGTKSTPYNHRYVWHFEKRNFEVVQFTGHWGDTEPFVAFMALRRDDPFHDIEYEKDIYIITDEGDTVEVIRKESYLNNF